MPSWRVTYRGRDDLTEETVIADEFIDNGEWVDFVRNDTSTSSQDKLLRVRASDVVEIRSIAQG